MKSVIKYTLDKCHKCMKCIQACPSHALSMRDDRILINTKECINCGRCIKACHNQGLTALASSLDHLKDYDYTVCLVPSSLVAHADVKHSVASLFNALRKLGFDEAISLSYIESGLYQKEIENKDELRISSFCPLVNNLVKKKYPALVDILLPYDYPSEIAAKEIREKYKGINVGIFNLCECEAKLELAKYPHNNKEYEVDHAISIVDIFPMISDRLVETDEDIDFNVNGLLLTCPRTIKKTNTLLAENSYDTVNDVLDMAEFGLLNEFKLLRLYPCYSGCLGGSLLWGNGYVAKRNLLKIKDYDDDIKVEIPEDRLLSKRIDDNIDLRTFKEKLDHFNNVNNIFEKLPGYDCTACGLGGCRVMAEEIVKGNRDLEDCKILSKEKRNDS